MGSSTTDIIARLRLNGGDFSSESARIFGAMEAQARDTAARTKSAFESSFQNIQQIATKALSLPRNAGGSLDLNVTGAREAAVAADATAGAFRQIATAAEQAAIKTGDNSEATRIYVTAARAAAVEQENLARSAHIEAAALEILQAEINQTRSSTELLIEGNRVLNATQDRGALSARGHGIATMQAGQQVQDFFIQVGGGQSIMVAFIQQASQAAYVLQSTGGQAGKFAAFLTSGWGTAVLAGATVLGIFWDKVVGSGDAVEEATKKLRDNAKQSDANRIATDAFGRTTDGMIESLRKQNDEIERQNRSLEENQRLKQKGVEVSLADARARSAELLGQLTAARRAEKEAADDLAELNRRPSADDGGVAISAAGLKLSEARAATMALEKSYDELGIKISQTERAMRSLEVQQSNSSISEKMDDQAKAAGNLRRELARLAEQRTNNAITQAEYDKQALEANQRYAAEQKRLRDQQRSDRAAERTMQLAAPVNGPVTSGFGARNAPRTTNGQRGSSYHPALDYGVGAGTQVRAGAEGVVVYTGTMGGYGKVTIVDYGKGTFGQFAHLSKFLAKPGDAVSAGQAIALSGATGNVTGPHLDYRVRTGARFENGKLQGGQFVDPRGRVKVGAAGDAQANYDDQAARAASERQRAMEDFIKASEKSLSVESESLRVLGLKVRGLGEQSEVEKELAEKRREYAEALAGLSADDRQAQERVSEGLGDSLALLEDQAGYYADLLRAAGDQTKLTEEQRAALADANAVLLEQLEGARALATTAADRLRIEEAIVRVSARLGTARGEGEKDARERKRVTDEMRRQLQHDKDEQYRREQDQISDLANFYRDAFRSGGKSIVEDFQDEMLDMIAEVAARWTLAMISGQKTSLGGILSQMGATSGAGGGAGGVLSALGLLGKGGSAAGGATGAAGAFSKIMGGASAAGGAGSGLLAGLSSAMPYLAIASVALPLVSSLFGSVFKSTKWGNASISMQDGNVVGGAGNGNKGGQVAGAAGAAGSVAEGINRLAAQLNATIKSVPGVTIGSWDGRARVALTSTTAPLHSKNFGNDVLKDFGDDDQAAIAYAIKYSVSHAVIDGISQASKNIIAKAGDDLDGAIEKALLIEDIPKRLQAKLDPVGYAIDQLNKQWEKTIDALEEGGATTEQMADAQRLYRMELDETKAAARSASADLKDFLKELGFGSNSPYSLRQQEDMARASLEPFLDKIKAGDAIDQSKYIEAAQAFLDIERKLYGSTGAFFEQIDRIQAATGAAISKIDNAVPIRTYADPFAEATASNTATSNDLLEQVSGQLGDVTQLLQQIAAGGTGNDYFADSRLFSKTGGLV